MHDVKIGRTTLVTALGGLLGLAVLAGIAMHVRPFSAPQAASDPLAETAHAAPAEQAAKPKPPADGPFVIKHILPIKGPIKYGEWYWDETAAPEKGPIVITVDLDARVLSIFRDGYEIGATAVLLGTQDHPTPTGVFPILEKKRHHTSNLYDAEMPYMQRLTQDGITLHAAEVEWGYASHGCIAMPEPFAAKVFSKTKVGDKVYITRGKMLDLGDSLVDS